jgi:hypothetical protein
MRDHWPCEAWKLDPQGFLMRLPIKRQKTCLSLKNFPHQKLLYLLPRRPILPPVGNLTYLKQKFYNDTAQKTQRWGSPNHIEPQPHPLANFANLQKAWNNLTTNID